MRDPQATTAKKATALAYVSHLVGDAHQPLHTSSRFSQTWPRGDKGGNYFLINNPAGNLHAYWDQMVQRFLAAKKPPRYPFSGKVILSISQQLQQQYPRTFFNSALEEASIYQWTHDSFLLAQQSYKGLTPGREIPKQYATWAETTAQQQITLAGYRLADLLNQSWQAD